MTQGRMLTLLVVTVLLAILTSLLVGGAMRSSDAPGTEEAVVPAVGAVSATQDPPVVQQAPTTAGRVAADPTATGTAVGARAATTVDIELTTTEREGQLDDGTTYTYWTFDDQVPGPMLRVRESDTVNLALTNSAESTNVHSIDLHAVNGPGGGATGLQVPPGETQSITFQALNPGVYVYHCATPHIPTHIANGMYGLIVVEPEGGLDPVDRELYVMQGEIYTAEGHGAPGLATYDGTATVAEDPSWIVFNGQANALTGDHAMQAEVGETVRVFVGNGGPNLTSSFHVIGEVFDRVSVEGGSLVNNDVQTTLVPAGGATWVEFALDVPGDYLLVDHAISRTIDRGALAILHVTGPEDPAVYEAHDAVAGDGHAGDATAAAVPAGAIEVSMTEFSFGADLIRVPAGEVAFHVVNDGAVPHELAIGVAGDGDAQIMTTGTVPAGEAVDVVVDLAPGTYEIGCHIPGHFDAGMHTVLEVG